MFSLKLKGARTHNLREVSLELHPGEVTVLTGVSGAGKSSLALHTLYAEGQRRFVESFSPYARQFLERLPRPPMEELEPVPAAVAVDRAAPVKSSRSTVSTMADLAPLLSGLFSREAVPVCPEHGIAAEARRVPEWRDWLIERAAGQNGVFTYSRLFRDVSEYLSIRDNLAEQGYSRLWVNGDVRRLDEIAPSQVADAHSVDVVVDRVVLNSTSRTRVEEALTQALKQGNGVATFHRLDEPSRAVQVTTGYVCPTCDKPLRPPAPGLFSHDSPLGACKRCKGFGRVIGIDPDKVIPDPGKTLKQRAIRPWNGKSTEWERSELRKLCERHAIPMDVPYAQLSEAHQTLLWEGDGSWDRGKFPGIKGWFAWLETRTYKMHVRVLLSKYRSYDVCDVCNGARFSETALGYHVAGLNIAEWNGLEVTEAVAKLAELETRSGQGQLIVEQLRGRLGYLERVGLGYLSLDRQARTLSGGENQRVTLTAALGTSLHNALFVLDEPSVGLHPNDVSKLSQVITELAARNNIVLVVEHDPTLIRAADRVVELGPGAGRDGGSITFDGTVTQALRQPCATRRALSPAPRPARGPRSFAEWVEVRGARENNLSDVDARFPVRGVTVVSGPSGSGKSSLCVDVLYRAIARRVGETDVERPGVFDDLELGKGINGVTLIDQSPLGRTSRGNAATYTKAWDHLRKLFANEPSAVQRGFTASHFSFNVAGGRCDACDGEGFETVEMQFLADVQLECPICRGQRFKPEVLSVMCRGKSVGEVLGATIDEVLSWFADQAPIRRTLGPLQHLGLGYLRLGQPLSTLSGGEAQRLKLARALNDKLDGQLFVVDEPSASLHADEVARVLRCFDWIVEGGGTVLAVEHDLDVIAAADWVIELGPRGGKHGGKLVFTGTVEELVLADSSTGRALAESRVQQTENQTPSRTVSASAPVMKVRHAREHTLKQANVDIPHQRLTVVTGPSGSGKSSLVFDVVFAEGQRRFLETLTPYARRFLPTLPKPDVDEVSGVPPSIALEQRTSRAGANSTVATVTELAHYLRLLFAKLGTPHCPEHGLPISSTSKAELLAQLHSQEGHVQLLAPVVEARKGVYLDVFDAAERAGIQQAWCDGVVVHTGSPPKLAKSKEHSIDLVVFERIEARDITESHLDQVFTWTNGKVRVRNESGDSTLYGINGSCAKCGLAIPELDPRWFSFNTEQGACRTCQGTGLVERGATTKKRRGRATRKEAEPKVLQSCPSCDGTRLAPIPRAVRVRGLGYADFTAMSVAKFDVSLAELHFSGGRAVVAEAILKELSRRSAFLLDVGLGYLALNRAASTLSGGELQRLRLAAQLGSGLTGALYVLDEPTIGLHPRDTARLVNNLRRLVDVGSTVLVVEHDAEVIRAADYLIDMGPTGGSAGGNVVAQGTPDVVLSHPASPTARELRGTAAVRKGRTPKNDVPRVRLSGVTANNLRNVTVEIPEGHLTVVAGVSGSGKSTLIRSVLLPAMRQQLDLVTEAPGAFDALYTSGNIKRAVSVDQSPIGRTPRSVPATFLGVWDLIRAIFARLPEAQVAGLTATQFSFNSATGGRCETCGGQGSVTHEMSFLPDVIQDCPECHGMRFNDTISRVKYRGFSAGEVLKMTIADAVQLFSNHPKITASLQTLVALGAGYLQLGQGSHTLSGGEAQRLKLAVELTAGTRHEPTLYVLDEPTTGLHQSDVTRLLTVLTQLVDRGDTLVVIEHQPWFIAGADHIIELGPEGGEGGGRIVATGTPKQVARAKTPTGQAIAPFLRN